MRLKGLLVASLAALAVMSSAVPAFANHRHHRRHHHHRVVRRHVVRHYVR